MLIPGLFSLVLLLADAPVAAPATPPPAPAPPATAAAPARPVVDPVIAEINALMAPYKGKSGDRLRGKLGFSIGKRPAIDGEVVFWELKIEQDMTCGMTPGATVMRCQRGDPFQCRLAIAFDKQGLVAAWAASGAPEVCRGFVAKLKAN